MQIQSESLGGRSTPLRPYLQGNLPAIAYAETLMERKRIALMGRLTLDSLSLLKDKKGFTYPCSYIAGVLRDTLVDFSKERDLSTLDMVSKVFSTIPFIPSVRELFIEWCIFCVAIGNAGDKGKAAEKLIEFKGALSQL